MRIAVFCGSASGHGPVYGDAAKQFGQMLARQGIGLFNGGGRGYCAIDVSSDWKMKIF
ncbi:hypothetical protein B932_3280 [Gluconobacter oxydans H24]|nr:hypothetical protein B932_3280 [Gluconobacter oxydans H24]